MPTVANVTVLIVDDNPNNLKVLESILTTAGYKVRAALNGDTALRAAKLSPPDLVLLDIRMPSMDGFEVCRRLKSDAETAHVPVIFISALQEMDDKVHAFQAGGVDYIVKPFQAEEVLTRARTHIELAQARNALAHSNETLELLVAERTRKLEATMRQEHALRELLTLSHNHFADTDYPVKALNTIAESLGWQPPSICGVILLTHPRRNTLEIAAHLGVDISRAHSLETMALTTSGQPDVGGRNVVLQSNDEQIDLLTLFGFADSYALASHSIVSGEKILGLFVLFIDREHSADFDLAGFPQQVADVLGMGLARREADETLAWHAYHDELTGLPNRRLLEEDLLREMKASDNRNNLCGILLIDIDHFKLLNDTLGHGTADLFLKEISQRLKSTIRASDLPYRWGGDEFIVLLPGVGNNEDEAVTHARSAAQKIAEKLSESIQIGTENVHFSASMGIALYPSDGSSTEELLKHVDLAMHKAKEAGRNTVHFFKPDMQSDAERRLLVEKELRTALIDKQFLLYYQPQVGVGGELLGAEALIRWQHPERGLVPPNEFIPVAEENGFIQQIGDWVLEEGCRQLRAWEGSNKLQRRRTLAMNVSMRQFHQPDFVERVHAILEKSGADPACVELEVTESLLLADVDGAVRKMDALRAMGIRFSVDDFGTGYSSLAYLKRLPVDLLKIDQSFVRDVHKDNRNASIVRTIISLAHNLGLKTIAEGVEQIEEFNFLSGAGCDEFQGYYFSKPLPLGDFTQRWKWD
ncbi:MAG: EAL domain-containing protein [Pseudomonadota bacterium]